jgi:hypothetical protein
MGATCATQTGPYGFQLHSLDLEDCPACGRLIGPKGPGALQTMLDTQRPTVCVVPVCRKCTQRLQKGSEAEQNKLTLRIDAFLRGTVPFLRRVDELPMPGRG